MIAAAVVAIGVNLLSFHSSSGFETFTPGVYAITKQGYAAGVFSNSHGNAAGFIGRQFDTPSISILGAQVNAGAMVGGVVGYGKPGPLLTGSLAAKLGDVTYRLTYIPENPAKVKSAEALHFSVEFAFGGGK